MTNSCWVLFRPNREQLIVLWWFATKEAAKHYAEDVLGLEAAEYTAYEMKEAAL